MPSSRQNDTTREPSVCRIMFYNTENLFDVSDNAGTEDGEFTPGGNMHWTLSRYYRKINNISKVIISVGGWQPPAIVGLCEIENRKVLNDLVYNTPFSKFGFRFIHSDSHDRRGIDVALLYDPLRVRILETRFLRIDTNIVVTRDILYARAIIVQDTFHLFVNHWPSRSSGQLETVKSRMAAAKLLKQVTDSVLNCNTASNMVIMGDFNDEPADESLKFLVTTPSGWGDPDGVSGLYNLSTIPLKGAVKGTLKYQGAWNCFDQMIVSEAMLRNKITGPDSYHICTNSFLLETDETWFGVKPFRTYVGFSYRGGFSDHLPVFIDLKLQTKP